MSGHTPGKWEARGCELIGAGTVIATIHWHSGREAENDADTRLIVAAPTLLKALQDICNATWQDRASHLKAGRAAIALATGGGNDA